MILLEGKEIAQKMQDEFKIALAGLAHPLRLAIVIVGSDPVSHVFVKLKEKYAKEIGVETRLYRFEESVTTNQLREQMNAIVHEVRNDGVIVQLPLPSHIDTQSILNSVIPAKDIDMLAARSVGDLQVGKAKILPPTARAVGLLIQKYDIEVKNKKAVVIGQGRLVGQPLALWLRQQGAVVTTFSDAEHFDERLLQDADIVISGVGKSGLVRGEHVKDGVIVIDLGTSEQAGKIEGDVDFDSVSKKAAYMTPVKGGVGPLTVACIFENLIKLSLKK